MSSKDSCTLTLATGYHARARPLWEGLVDTGNLNLKVIPMRKDGERHRLFHAGEFDAAELSMALYLSLKSQGAPMVALPIFPNRRFRHACIYVKEGSPIRKPKELKGKSVGIPSYINTCGLWARGILKDEYGVSSEDIIWKAKRQAENFAPPAGFTIELLPEKKELRSCLLEGLVDAVISPEFVQLEREGVRRLIAAAKEAERDYYRRTKIFPIAHAVVIRRHRLEEKPWVAQKLFDAWTEAKRIALEDDEDPTYSNFAWVRDLWQEERTLFGPDAWPYGIAPNRKIIETLIRYAADQGILKQRLEPDSLFHPVQE
jgi:4,5-dihydroxyphthalate decarboxylase